MSQESQKFRCFCPENSPLYSPNRAKGVSWPPWPIARTLRDANTVRPHQHTRCFPLLYSPLYCHDYQVKSSQFPFNGWISVYPDWQSCIRDLQAIKF